MNECCKQKGSKMTNGRRLVMEDMGIDPKSIFTDEQVKKMRAMKPRGRIREGTSGSSYIKICDRNS